MRCRCNGNAYRWIQEAERMERILKYIRDNNLKCPNCDYEKELRCHHTLKMSYNCAGKYVSRPINTNSVCCDHSQIPLMMTLV